MKIKINDNFNKVAKSYLFSEVGRRVKEYRASHPEAAVISLGIGDVTLPLSGCVVDAMKQAADEMGKKETFRGYAPEYGYDFLREAIAKHYASFNVALDIDDIFVSDGAKSDVGNIVDVLGDNEVIIPDPVYPVYLDSNVMSGRKIRFISGNAQNGFLPSPRGLSGEGLVIYLCSPNNPTGAVFGSEGLREWVSFARSTGSLIIYDSAYEAFIGGSLPHSIYCIEGAHECCIEICSFSKTAGFTGTRCAWTVVPRALTAGDGTSLNSLWKRRQATKFNGVAYVVQRAAQAALSEQGMKECRESIAYYLENARLISELLQKKNIRFWGGDNSPYLWLECPNGMSSWEFFDFLLDRANIVGTPGSGFGSCGEGYFRLTSFGSRENTKEAVERLDRIL